MTFHRESALVWNHQEVQNHLIENAKLAISKNLCSHFVCYFADIGCACNDINTIGLRYQIATLLSCNVIALTSHENAIFL